MRVGFIQNAPTRRDRDGNLARAAALIAGNRADLWVLPELFATGYLMADREDLAGVAEPVPDGPTTAFLRDLAARHDCAFVAGLPEVAPEGLFNAAVAVDASGLRAVYRKVHLFDTERRVFDPGSGPYPVVDLAGARVGLMICFDWRFPEPARALALAGAQVIAHPSNLVLPHCQAAMVTRALENRVFTVTANRVGDESVAGMSVTFTGGSRIVAPDGRVLSDGPAERTAVGVVEIDPALADDKAINDRNDLFSDRRPGAYFAFPGSPTWASPDDLSDPRRSRPVP